MGASKNRTNESKIKRIDQSTAQLKDKAVLDQKVNDNVKLAKPGSANGIEQAFIVGLSSRLCGATTKETNL